MTDSTLRTGLLELIERASRLCICGTHDKARCHLMLVTPGDLMDLLDEHEGEVEMGPPDLAEALGKLAKELEGTRYHLPAGHPMTVDEMFTEHVRLPLLALLTPKVHSMLPGSHEWPRTPECRCGYPWDRSADRCTPGPTGSP